MPPFGASLLGGIPLQSTSVSPFLRPSVCLSVCLHNMIWARVRLIRPTWPWVLFADHLAKDARRLVEKKNSKKKEEN